jgi:hypothetical protein
MQVRKLIAYRIPAYPFQDYQYHTDYNKEKIIASLFGFLIANSKCSSGGLMLYPPIFLEYPIRPIVDKIFLDEGIALIHNYPVSFPDDKSNIHNCSLDGFNDSLKIGYEYFSTNDEQSYEENYPASCDCNEDFIDPQAEKFLCGSNSQTGWNILCIDRMEKTDNPYQLADLELKVKDFIAELKAQGVL